MIIRRRRNILSRMLGVARLRFHGNPPKDLPNYWRSKPDLNKSFTINRRIKFSEFILHLEILERLFSLEAISSSNSDYH